MVEDNHLDVFVMRNILTRTGLPFELTVIADGERALARVRDETQGCPDLMLLDLNIPFVSGLEILKTIRTSRRCPEVRVIVVTSSESPEDREEVQRLGGDAFFSKPTDLKVYEELGGIIRRLSLR